jgi:anti-sigma factor RsiW
MNCLDFRRELNTDPRRLSPPAQAHAEACPACARRMAGQVALEARLAGALRVDPPAGLADRVLLAARMGRQRQMRLYALAAGVVLAVGVSLSLPVLDRPENLARMGIAHVLAEPQFLARQAPVDPAVVAEEFVRVGARVEGALPAVHAAPCPVPGGDGAHIVLKTPYGMVTVLLIPNRDPAELQRAAGRGYIAVVHHARRGCYTLVATSERALAYAQAMLERSLRWS